MLEKFWPSAGVRQGWNGTAVNESQHWDGSEGFWAQLLSSYPVATNGGATALCWAWQKVQPMAGGSWDPLEIGTSSGVPNPPGTTSASNPIIVNGGANYYVGDTITIGGGTTFIPTVLQVTAINSIGGFGGPITGVIIINPGEYTTAPTIPASQEETSGGGSGATFDLTYSATVNQIPNGAFESSPPSVATLATIIQGGFGYEVGDTITLAGGTSTPSYSNPTILTVSSVGLFGVVTGVSGVTITTPGTYLTPPTNPVAQFSSSGGGSGATFTMTYSAPVTAGISQSGDVVWMTPGYRDNPDVNGNPGLGLMYTFLPYFRKETSSGAYLAYTGLAGISAATIAGNIWSFPSAVLGYYQQIGGIANVTNPLGMVQVYNLCLAAVPSNIFVEIIQDVYGTWWAIETQTVHVYNHDGGAAVYPASGGIEAIGAAVGPKIPANYTSDAIIQVPPLGYTIVYTWGNNGSQHYANAGQACIDSYDYLYLSYKDVNGVDLTELLTQALPFGTLRLWSVRATWLDGSRQAGPVLPYQWYIAPIAAQVSAGSSPSGTGYVQLGQFSISSLVANYSSLQSGEICGVSFQIIPLTNYPPQFSALTGNVDLTGTFLSPLQGLITPYAGTYIFESGVYCQIANGVNVTMQLKVQVGASWNAISGSSQGIAASSASGTYLALSKYIGTVTAGTTIGVFPTYTGPGSAVALRGSSYFSIIPTEPI